MNSHPDRVVELLKQAEEEGILTLYPPDNATVPPAPTASLQRVLAAASGFDDEWIDVDFRRPFVECSTSGEDWPFREIGSPGVRGAAWVVEVSANGEWCGIWYQSDDVYVFVARSLSEWLELLVANRRYARLVPETQAENSYFLIEDQLDRAAADISRDNAHLPGISQWVELASSVPPLSITGRAWRIADFRYDASARGFRVRGRRSVVPLEANLFAVRGPRVPRIVRSVVMLVVWWWKAVASGISLIFVFLAVLSLIALLVWLAEQLVNLL